MNWTQNGKAIMLSSIALKFWIRIIFDGYDNDGFCDVLWIFCVLKAGKDCVKLSTIAV